MSALDPAQEATETIYDRLGGDAGLGDLVGVFYSSSRTASAARDASVALVSA